MGVKIASSYNFLWNTVSNFKVGTSASDPGTGASFTAGMYYNTTNNTLRFHNGTTWIPVGYLNQMLVNADIDIGSFKITTTAVPSGNTELVNKAYVDSLVRGLSWKQAVRAGTTANITLSGTQTIDGVALAVGDRVLVKNQTTANQNGIYLVASGAWTRTTDADTGTLLSQATMFIQEGTTLADTVWTCSTDGAITVGTTNLTFIQSSGAGSIIAGNGLVQSGNTLNVQGQNGVTTTADHVELTGQALALHNLATNGIIVRTGSGTVAARSITAATNTSTIIGATITNGDGVSGNPTVGIPTATSGGINGTANTVARSDHSHDGVYAKRFVGLIGNGVLTTISVAHGLNSQYPDCRFYEVSSGEEVIPDLITFTDVNNLSVQFAGYTPANNGVRIIVSG